MVSDACVEFFSGLHGIEYMSLCTVFADVLKNILSRFISRPES